MDRGMKPVYVKDKNVTSGDGSDGQLSPPTASSQGAASPVMMPRRHSRSGSIGKRSQNTKEAAQRMARMMSHQLTNDSEDDDDFLSDYNPTSSVGRSQIRPRSPMVSLHVTYTMKPVIFLSD